MNRSASGKARKYESDLRDAQAEATRQKILDSLVQVLADGVDTLSIPAVASRAGVSVGTVYRHFGDKAGLLKALIPYARTQTGTSIDSIPDTLEGIDEVVREVFQHFENTNDLLQAALTSQVGQQLRISGTPERLDALKGAFRQLEPDINETNLDHAAKLALILTTSDAYRLWRDRLGLQPDEAADEVMWTIETLLKGLRS
jgi:AcrR family transcriptional regulator